MNNRSLTAGFRENTFPAVAEIDVALDDLVHETCVFRGTSVLARTTRSSCRYSWKAAPIGKLQCHTVHEPRATG